MAKEARGPSSDSTGRRRGKSATGCRCSFSLVFGLCYLVFSVYFIYVLLLLSCHCYVSMTGCRCSLLMAGMWSVRQCLHGTGHPLTGGSAGPAAPASSSSGDLFCIIIMYFIVLKL